MLRKIQRDRRYGTHIPAPAAQDAFRSADLLHRIDGHGTGTGALSAHYTGLFVHSHPDKTESAEKGIEGAERAQIPAEEPRYEYSCGQHSGEQYDLPPNC